MLTRPRKYSPGLKIEYLNFKLEIKSPDIDLWHPSGEFRTIEQIMTKIRKEGWRKQGWKFRITEL